MWLQTECRLGKGPAGPFPLPLTPEVWGKAFALPLSPTRRQPLSHAAAVFIATWEVVIFFVGLNLIDYAIVALFALSVLVGLHRGTVATGLNLLALGLSLVIAKLCYPLAAEWIAGHETWMNYLVYFSEGSSHIPTAMMEYARADITTLTAEQVQQVIRAANFSAPFDEYLASNIAGQVYAGQYFTLFDYFNQTVADVSLNTLSFLLVFAFAYLVSTLLVRLIDDTFCFPLLKACDSLVGGALGLLRGYVLMMLLATMVPLVLNMLQIQLIHDLVDGSVFLKHFYPGNWFFGWIRSIL